MKSAAVLIMLIFIIWIITTYLISQNLKRRSK
jgi:hypothetical protein